MLPLRLVIISALAAGAVACGGQHQAVPLTVTWNESEGHPACRYLPAKHQVAVSLRIDGDAGEHGEVIPTVTAYADENTSDPVGSASRTVTVHGTVHEKLQLTIAVPRPPHVGEDDVAACKLAVKY